MVDPLEVNDMDALSTAIRQLESDTIRSQPPPEGWSSVDHARDFLKTVREVLGPLESRQLLAR